MLFEAFSTTKPENRLFRQVPQVPASVIEKLRAAWGE
jgi:hypothetical protein